MVLRTEWDAHEGPLQPPQDGKRARKEEEETGRRTPEALADEEPSRGARKERLRVAIER